jgi:hypothetical protein
MMQSPLILTRKGERVVFPVRGATDARLTVETFSTAVASATLNVLGGIEPNRLVPFASAITITSAAFASGPVATIERVNGEGGLKGLSWLAVEVDGVQTGVGDVLVTLYPERYT